MGRSPLQVAFLVTLALLAAGWLLLGIPGALLFVLTTALVLGHDGSQDLHPDAAWPIAIWISLAFPPVIPPATWLLCRRWPGWSSGRLALAVAAVTLAWGAALSLTFYAISPGR